MRTRLIDKETGEVICEVVTNRSMTFDEVAQLGGLEWKEYPDLPDPNGYTGWYNGSEYVSEETAEMETVS